MMYPDGNIKNGTAYQWHAECLGRAVEAAVATWVSIQNQADSGRPW